MRYLFSLRFIFILYIKSSIYIECITETEVCHFINLGFKQEVKKKTMMEKMLLDMS